MDSTSVLGLRSSFGPLGASLLLAAALKVALLIAGVVPFNADEAVVALMARHILQGERPVFFYGQAYMGSLDAWLIAGAFRLLGESVAAVRVVQSALYLGTVSTAYLLARRIYPRLWVAGAAVLFLALPTVLVSLYTTATLGGYGEMLLIGNLILLLTLHLSTTGGRWLGWSVLGLLSGLGFWGFPLVGVYILPSAVYLWMKGQRRPARWALLGVGFILAAAPWWWATLLGGARTLAEIGGSAISGASASQPVLAFAQHVFYFLMFGPTVISGLRPPWNVAFLALPMAPFALALYSALVVFVFRRPAPGSSRPGRGILLGVCVTLIAAYLLTPFGADPSGRYFLPLAVPVALLTAEMLDRSLRRGRAASAWVANATALGLVAFNFWGTAQSAIDPLGLTTQFDAVTQVDHRHGAALIQFLRERGETRGYSNYWVEFPLAFLSGEELIFSARLPYHLDFRYTARDDRYPPYSRAVDESPKVAYITTRHAPLDARIRDGLTRLGVDFLETQIGDYRVFYGLARAVRPQEIGLGVSASGR